jgi:hypothetical protein
MDKLNYPSNEAAEVVERLLQHLNIEYIALAAHSAGVIYAFNVMFNIPHILHPIMPRVAFFAPWLHPIHTTSRPFVPKLLLLRQSYFSKFVKNFETAARRKKQLRRVKHSDTPLAVSEWDDPGFIEELCKEIRTYIFAESLEGVSDDARLCLKRGPKVPWGTANVLWSDFDEVLTLVLVILLEDYPDLHNHGGNWSIDVFYAENDEAVGERGRGWFDDCWDVRTHLVGLSESDRQRVNNFRYASSVIPSSTHEGILWYSQVADWFGEVRKAFEFKV